MRWTNRSPDRYRPLRDVDNVSGGACQLRFGSPHSGALHGVYTDGSVHAIEYDIDMLVWEYLGVRNDGETVN